MPQLPPQQDPSEQPGAGAELELSFNRPFMLMLGAEINRTWLLDLHDGQTTSSTTSLTL